MFNNRVAVAALASVIVIIGGAFALTRLTAPGPDGLGGPGPTPTSATTGVPSPSPMPSASASPVRSLTAAEVGKALQAGTYRVDGFAAPFSVTLPDGWNVSELTPNSIGLGVKANGSINVFMSVMGKVYSDPCHTKAGPTAVGTGVAALVGALSSMSGFQVTEVSSATVGGATGKGFKITNSIDVAASKCSGTMLPIGTYDKSGADVDVSMFGGETDRFWVVDAGGVRVLIAVTDNAVVDTGAVRESLRFGD